MIWSYRTFVHLLQALLVHLWLYAEVEKEPIHDLFLKLLDEASAGKHGQVIVDAADRLDKTVVVDAADEVCQEVCPNIFLNAGKNKLENIQDTGTKVTVPQVKEDNLATEESGKEL